MSKYNPYEENKIGPVVPKVFPTEDYIHWVPVSLDEVIMNKIIN